MKVPLVAPNPYWKLYYQKEASRIAAALQQYQLAATIEHIGSTSIPIIAKPTIDILIGLSPNMLLDDCIAAFAKLGYIYVSKYNEALPMRRFFIKIKSKSLLEKRLQKEIAKADEMPPRQSFERLFHVHIVHKESLFFRQHLAFRNHIRANEYDRTLYQELKQHLSQQDWEVENDYAQAKAGFIEDILNKIAAR